MTNYARTNRERYRQYAEELAEDVEDLMLIKSLTSGAQLTVRVADYTWVGSVSVLVELEGVDRFEISVNSNGYEFKAESGIVRARLETILKKRTVRFSSKDPLLQMIRRYVL